MKKAAIDMEMLIKIILIILAAIVIGGIVGYATKEFGSSDIKKYACWVSNGLRSSNIMMREFLPNACELTTIDEPITKVQLVEYMKEAWWMFGKGKWDYELGGTHERPVYYFRLAEDLTRTDFFKQLYYFNGGRLLDAEHMDESDYTYIESGSDGPTICYGKSIAAEGEEPTMKKEKYYYLVFYDDSRLLGEGKEWGDKIVITSMPSFSQEKMYYCESMLPGEEGLTIDSEGKTGILSGIKSIPSRIKNMVGL